MKKFFKKAICVAAVCCLMISASAVNAFASNYVLQDNLSDEELFDAIWELVYKGSGPYHFSAVYLGVEEYNADVYGVVTSITYYELTQFLSDYEVTSYLTTKANIQHEFESYMEDMYSDTAIECAEDGSVYEYNINDPDMFFYYSYDENTDKYICTDEDDNIIKSYAAYHDEDYEFSAKNAEKLAASASSETSSDSSEDVSSDTSSGSSGDAVSSSDAATASDDYDYPVAGESIDTDNVMDSALYLEDSSTNGGMSTAQIVVLSVVGTLVVVGVIAVIVFKTKKGKGEK